MDPGPIAEQSIPKEKPEENTKLPPDAIYRLSHYDYQLPENLVAKYPLDRRDQSRMLLLDREAQSLSHRQFCNLPELLQPGDLIVANNTRVLPARLLGTRQGCTGRVEVLLLHPDPGATQADPQTPQWLSMTRPTKRMKIGTIIEFPGTTSTVEIISLGVGVRTAVKIHLGEDAHGNPLKNVEALMDAVGHVPIPPYLKRDDEAIDKITYQTVYSKIPGSQAAPTAGLHFTPDIIRQLEATGIGFAELTLSVSSGTFRSVDTEDIREHRMDPEHYSLPQETIDRITETKARDGRVIAVGTTTLKTLETIAAKYNGQLQPEADWSKLFIYPGFQFNIVDGLLTNFHLPKTTLMMLVSAFASHKLIMDAYRLAVQEQYRFFSYGDCMLIL